MSGWIRLTGKDGKSPVFVNMSIATHLVAVASGSHVCFGDGGKEYVAVMESPSEVIEKLYEQTRANRA